MAPKTTVTISAASHVAMAQVEDGDEARGQRTGGEEADERSAAEHPGALARLLAALGHLGLGQVDLLTDQRAGLARQVLDQLADRLIAGIAVVRLCVGAHAPYPLTAGGGTAHGHRRPAGDGHRGHGRGGRRSRERTLVALAAGRLQEARGGEADRDAEADDGQRLTAPEVLEVAEDAVRARLAEVPAEALGVVGGLLGGLRRAVLALVAQLPARAPQGLRGCADLLAGLRRALVDLLAHAHLRLLSTFLDLLLRLLRLLLHLLLGVVGRRA